jgi:tetratricopeptide (TPR) repeat protein
MDRERNPDRERLSGVHRSEQSSESRVNEEFVDWLKTKGPTYLLIAVLLLLGYLWWVRLADSREAREAHAWHALQEAEVAGLPSSYEHVAEQYDGVASVGVLARLRAAQRLMDAVQRGVPVGAGADPIEGASTLSDDERESYLARAERLYREVLDRDGDRRRDLTIFAVKSRNGLAAIAEARGDLDAAISHYEQAAIRAVDAYPHLAAQARRRAETIDIAESIVSLPTQEERERIFPSDLIERTPISVDSAFRDLLLQ